MICDCIMTKIYVKLHIEICDTNAYFGILLISKKKQNGMVNQCGHSYLHISYMSKKRQLHNQVGSCFCTLSHCKDRHVNLVLSMR